MNETSNEILLYQSADGQRVEVQLRGDTLWLALNQIAELFGRDKSVISRHLRNIFKDGELERSSVVAKNATTAADGKTRSAMATSVAAHFFSWTFSTAMVACWMRSVYR